MIVTPDPSVSQHIALTDTAVVPGTPLTLQPPGVTVSTVEKPDVIGLAITAVSAGDNVAYIAYGTLELSDWTAIIGSPTLTPGVYYYLGIDHFLTATPPFAGQLVEIGRAESETVFDINIKTAIFLSNVNFFTIFDTLTLISAASASRVQSLRGSDLLTISETILANDTAFGVASDLLTISEMVMANDEAFGVASDLLTIMETLSSVHAIITTESEPLTIIDTVSEILIVPFYFFDFNSFEISSTINGSSITTLSSGTRTQPITGLGVDPVNGLLFWDQNGGFVSMPIAGGASQNCSATPRNTPLTAMFLDFVNQYIWTSGGSGGFFSVWAQHYNTDGSTSGSQDEPYTSSGSLGGLAIDRVNSIGFNSPIIYVADNAIPAVRRAAMKYSSGLLISPTNIYTPVGTLGVMACDEINGHLFVMDGTNLYSMGLTGSSPTKIVSVGAAVKVLFVDKVLQKIYALFSDQLVQYNYDGSSPTTILTSSDVRSINYGMDLQR